MKFRSEEGETEGEESRECARPFSHLQQRLGRKKVSEKMLRENPVAYLAFDVLYANGELMIERPLQERAHVLDSLLAAPRRSVQQIDHAGGQTSLAFQAEAEEERSRGQHYPRAGVSGYVARRIGAALRRSPRVGAMKA